MKLLRFLPLVAIAVAPLVDANEKQTSLRRRTQGLRDLTQPCLLVISHMQLEGNLERESMVCELMGADAESGKDPFVVVNGLPSNFMKMHHVESGGTTIYADGALIDDKRGVLFLPSNTAVSTENRRLSDTDDRRLAQVKRKVLVIRVEGSDRVTTASEPQLSDQVFSSSGDTLNLKTQYAACSYNQLVFEKSDKYPEIGDDGVYTVKIPNSIVGETSSTIRRLATNQVLADFGASSLNQLADNVMVCIPPGTVPNGWIAFGYTNSYLTVYNDHWCSSVSAQMHELGHNLGLSHSGDDSGTTFAQYEDQSGMMGFSYSQTDWPRMCFNGAKSYQLGWFTDYHMDLKPSSAKELHWSGNLIGFVDRDNAESGDNMIVRIETDAVPSSADVYIHFNRKAGFNDQTYEGGDRVHITHRPEGVGSAISTRVATLSASDNIHTIENFEESGNDLIITVDSIDFASVPARAKVSIQYGGIGRVTGGGDTNTFVQNIEYKHNVLENEDQWEAIVGTFPVVNGGAAGVREYFDHYGITIPDEDHSGLIGANAFNPDSSKLLNIPIDCRKRDDSFRVTYSGVGKNDASKLREKNKYCGWFVSNNQKFCPLVDLDPNRAFQDPATGEIVRPRIWQTCHQECSDYTHCDTKG